MYPQMLYFFLWIRKAGVSMSPQIGRPTDDPKTLNTRVRLSQEDVERLNYCSEMTGKTKSEIIREGIKVLYDGLKK